MILVSNFAISPCSYESLRLLKIVSKIRNGKKKKHFLCEEVSGYKINFTVPMPWNLKCIDTHLCDLSKLHSIPIYEIGP